MLYFTIQIYFVTFIEFGTFYVVDVFQTAHKKTRIILHKIISFHTLLKQKFRSCMRF